MAKYDIFISYRREGGYDTAKHLYDLLTRDGYKVSFDIDTLRNGDFDISLLSRIEECRDFILIVDNHAFDRTLDSTFNPDNDWLRQELAFALKKDKNIIPVFLNGIQEFPSNLPADLKEVVKKNGPKYDRYYFNDFYKVLKQRFLTARKGNRVGIFLILLAVLSSIGCVCYSIPREGKATSLCITLYSILWVITLIALIVGLANPHLVSLNNRKYVSWYILPSFLSMVALGCGIGNEEKNSQNQDYTPYLTARQMNIYFGHPKKIVSKNSNDFTMTAEFDEQGNIKKVDFNGTLFKYDWKNKNQIIICCYSNEKFVGSMPIDILDFSELKYSYTVSGAINIDVAFNPNGVIQEMTVTNPESIFTTIYNYSSEDDEFPISVTQKMDDQVVKINISINEFDNYGNPLKFTESFFGNTVETIQSIEYF